MCNFYLFIYLFIVCVCKALQVSFQAPPLLHCKCVLQSETGP